MIIDRLYQPILCKWKMLELGGCPSWADPYRSNMYEIWGKQFLGVGTIKKIPRNLPTNDIYISQSLSNSISGALAFFFSRKKKKERELQKEKFIEE